MGNNYTFINMVHVSLYFMLDLLKETHQINLETKNNDISVFEFYETLDIKLAEIEFMVINIKKNYYP